MGANLFARESTALLARLAELALMSRTPTDPQTQQDLRHIADDYFRLAEQVEAKASGSTRG